MFSRYECKVNYNDKVYNSIGSILRDYYNSSGTYSNMITKKIECVPQDIMTFLKVERVDSIYYLRKGVLVFGLDEENLGFKEVFPIDSHISYDSESGEIVDNLNLEDFGFDDVSMKELFLFLSIVAKRNDKVFEYINNDDFVRSIFENGRFSRNIVIKNCFNTILNNIEGFEKVINSGNIRLLEKNMSTDDFHLESEGKLNKVIGLPKFAISFIKDNKYENLYESFKMISDEFNGNSLKILCDFYGDIKKFLKNSYSVYGLPDFTNKVYLLMKHYDYKITDLLNYLLKQKMYNSHNQIGLPIDEITMLYDYLEMSKRYDLKFDKFEQNIKKSHDIVQQNIKLLESSVDKDELFKKSVSLYKDFAFQINDDYSMVLPKDISDLIREGNSLHHCVGSYVDRIISGNSKILFFRDNSSINNPLVTVELNSYNKLVQQRAAFNSSPELYETEPIRLWASKIKKIGQ